MPSLGVLAHGQARIGMKAILGRQQKEREHLVKLMCRQDQPSVPLPASSHPAETTEHIPAPSSSGVEHDTLLRPVCANEVCRHFPSTAAAVLPKPFIAAPSMGHHAPALSPQRGTCWDHRPPERLQWGSCCFSVAALLQLQVLLGKVTSLPSLC